MNGRLWFAPDPEANRNGEEMNGGDTGDIQTYCRGELLAFLLRKRAWEVKRSPTELGYRVMPGWEQLPEGQALGRVAGVAADSADRIYVFHRGKEGCTATSLF